MPLIRVFVAASAHERLLKFVLVLLRFVLMVLSCPENELTVVLILLKLPMRVEILDSLILKRSNTELKILEKAFWRFEIKRVELNSPLDCVPLIWVIVCFQSWTQIGFVVLSSWRLLAELKSVTSPFEFVLPVTVVIRVGFLAKETRVPIQESSIIGLDRTYI
jgi:hypothetical protein